MDSKPLYTKITVPNGQQCHLEPQEEGLTQEASRPRACCVLVHVAQTVLRVLACVAQARVYHSIRQN